MTIDDLVPPPPLSWEEGEVEVEEISVVKCIHIGATTPPLLRASKLEKSISKLKTPLDQFKQICLHCARLFSTDGEATVHGQQAGGGNSASPHAFVMNLQTGAVACALCAFVDVGQAIKKSQQNELATLFASLNMASICSKAKPVKKKKHVKEEEEEAEPEAADTKLPPPPRGLKNLGNTCFFNSSVQLLCHSALVRRRLMREDNSEQVVFGPIASAFRNFLLFQHQASSSSSSSSVSPKHLLDTVCDRACQHLGDGAQHDAQELLMFLLAGMDDEATPSSSSSSSPCAYRADHEWRTKHAQFWFPGVDLAQVLERAPAEEEDGEDGHAAHCERVAFDFQYVPQSQPQSSASAVYNASKDLFQLEVDSVVTCEHCRHVSTQREVHSMLSLAVNNSEEQDAGGDNVGDAFSAYFSTPDALRVSDNNAYRCDKCRADRNAEREFRLRRAGPLLLLHLKRFRHAAASVSNGKGNNSKHGGGGHKLTKTQHVVPAPDTLTVSIEEEEEEAQEYRLVGFVEHLGASLTRGHYVAYLNNNNISRWFRCSDETVTAVTRTQARAAQVYIALYEKIT